MPEACAEQEPRLAAGLTAAVERTVRKWLAKIAANLQWED
jgi:hypothetical protein